MLAIRTILVGTRAAARTHRETKQPGLERASIERGLELLGDLDARHADDMEPDAARASNDARRDLNDLLAAIPIEPDPKPTVSRRE